MVMFSSMLKMSLGVIIASLFTIVFSLSVQASDPLAGMWELNLQKSKFSPGPAPKSKTRVYEVTGEQEKMIATTIDAAGNENIQKFSANRDGKPYPFEGWPMADTISIVPVDTFTVTYTMKKADKIVYSGTRVISENGKLMTLPVKFTSANGKEVDNIEVYDRK
jgi:hypothetical protein